jgi:hypothetical protein
LDFRLRTDAVWEKQKLFDFFRLYYKNFLFDWKKKQYMFAEPREAFTWIFERWNLGTRKRVYQGYTTTGRTVG